ncbi:RHS repeat-associated core domain-containing protein [Desulfatibacillum alkenivorans DSM 16219]|uniref:RHS repeat-associated core domain-containing protein n=1 Tax=Desulfatibacillum alkenivorans DSM 16219 TaxID=1121393 RepID=A0A1M6RGB5_9BACT|nr:RHS repeat-associated core domain-containing protein [Desulfatibacillum alkenivorans]SHK31407.1 RHS repeat-associated core domain-containing protein [Desulfatibacillum alkenivorans DSM 16219]
MKNTSLFRAGVVLCFLAGLYLASASLTHADDMEDWLSVQTWGVKMRMVESMNGSGSYLSSVCNGCNANFQAVVNHISLVEAVFEKDDAGVWFGTLKSKETVHNSYSEQGYGGDEYCQDEWFSLTEECSGEGLEEDYTFLIHEDNFTYQLCLPHTGIECAKSMKSDESDQVVTGLVEINNNTLMNFPMGAYNEIPNWDFEPCMEFDLPDGGPQVISGSVTFQDMYCSHATITWEWELTPDPEPAPPVETDLGCPDENCEGTGGDAGSGLGVPTWAVNMSNLNVFITDTPIWHTSPIGPPVQVTLSYNSQSQTAVYEPTGRKWQLNYNSYIDFNLATGEYIVYLPDGSREVFTPNLDTGFLDPPYGSYNALAVISMEQTNLTFPDGTVYVYRLPENSYVQPFLSEIRDPYGNKLTLNWAGLFPAGGKLLSIQDALGRLTTFHYNDRAKIDRITDPFNRSAYLSYNDDGDLVRITDMGGYFTTFAYESGGTIASMTQGADHWSFDVNATSVTVSSALGLERFVLTSGLGQSQYQSAMGSGGSSASFVYDLSSAPDNLHKDVTQFTTPEGVGFQYSYDSKRNLLEDCVEIPAGDGGGVAAYRYTYNHMGKVASVTDPKNNRIDMTYAGNGVDLLAVTNGLGSITATYDAHHGIKSLTDRTGYTKTNVYNSYGQLTSSTDSLGTATNYIYNDNHQLAGVQRAGLIIGAYTYDGKERAASFTDAAGYTCRYAYNNLDNITSITYPDDRSTTFTYSSSRPHLVSGVTDPAGRRTEFQYNALRQITRAAYPDGSQTAYSYHKDGRLAEITDPLGRKTSYTYDRDGNLSQKTYPDGRSVSLEYSGGRLKKFTNARGIATNYTYDLNGNLLTIVYSDDTPSVVFTYDAYNRPVTVRDGLGSRTLTYDAASRPLSIDGPWENDTLQFSYDLKGRKTSQTLENGPSMEYACDALDRLTVVTSTAGIFAYGYTGASQYPSVVERPDGGFTQFTHDEMNRLTRLENLKADNSLINAFGYTFNNQGMPSAETVDNGPALNFSGLKSSAANFNPLNQLTSLQPLTGSCEYDADGNMTKGLTRQGYVFSAAYDGEGRLASLEYTDAGGNLHRREYTYRSDGFLGLIKIFQNGDLQEEKRLIRLGPVLVQERNGANEATADYVWGRAEEGGVGALLAVQTGGQAYYPLFNARGDVTALLNAAGDACAWYAYDPYGNLLHNTGAPAQPFRFSTKEYDEETGLYYFGRRFYSPVMARWLTRDPKGEGASLNLYEFSRSNPLAYFDPLGAQDAELAAMDARWAQARAAMEASSQSTATASDSGGFGEMMSNTVGKAFKWVGDLIQGSPDAAGTVVDKVVDTALESNKFTKMGKTGYDAIQKGFDVAQDAVEISEAWNDPDPASGFTLLKKTVKYTCGRVPGVGTAFSEIMTEGIETVEHSQATQALRNREQTIMGAVRRGQ